MSSSAAPACSEWESFMKAFPSFASTVKLDDIRSKEFSRLDKHGQIYFDYTGGGLYAESQITAHQKMMVEGVFGNPHSTNPTSLYATNLVEETRDAILKFFNADPKEYTAIFTQNASGALKIVGESYMFRNGRYLLTYDNHNSVNGIRQYAAADNAEVTYVPLILPNLRIDEEFLEMELSRPKEGYNNLFAFPAQSNFSSVKHDLKLIDVAQKNGWDVLLDAAAFVPTSKLDLSIYKPDYIPISFYKMFGYPTGLGVLIAKNSALKKLRKPWFSGGTIAYASVIIPDKFYLENGSAAFEDGTLNYLGIPAIKIGLDFMDSIGYELITERVRCLTGWTLKNLSELRHTSGIHLVKVYGPLDTTSRGGAITVNFFAKSGRIIDHREVERLANSKNISLRTGCFCNPGAGEAALEIERWELDECYFKNNNRRITRDDFKVCFDGKANGAVRISIGAVTNFEDVKALLSFARSFLE